MKRVSKVLMVLFLAMAVFLTGCSGDSGQEGAQDVKQASSMLDLQGMVLVLCS